ncbi:MAG: hypothetical protein EA395_09880 [Phormidium sp. GEM2.Bin31]|nr:MAG: hypothetical protein EA395_09880 [Phormidium sp. GEM2.Bin31]
MSKLVDDWLLFRQRELEPESRAIAPLRADSTAETLTKGSLMHSCLVDLNKKVKTQAEIPVISGESPRRDSPIPASVRVAS